LYTLADYDSDQAQASYQFQSYDGSDEHKAKLSHELIAGAASYEAAKAYEEHVARNGSLRHVVSSYSIARKTKIGLAQVY
jgi:hypothetical protein